MARLVVFGDPGDPRKWVSIANEIAARITDGRYPSGEWLPPIMKISADLGNGTTGNDYRAIERALDEICAQGLTTFAEHAGYYTGDQEPPEKPDGRLLRYANKASARPKKPQARKPSPREQFLSNEEYITGPELANMLRLSKMTVYRMIHHEKLPASYE